MKIFGFLFLFFAMFLSSVNAQWQKQNVNTDASFRGLSVVSEKVIWASGTGGTVIKTVDGGKNWNVIKVPDADKLDFRDIEAFDENTAYILSIGNGESSRIYKTTDGGKNWKLQFKNESEKAFFDALSFWDSKNGMAMSDPVDGKYLLLKTTDGETWKLAGNEKMANTKTGEAAFAASGTCLLTSGKNDIFLVSGGMDARVFRSETRGREWFVSDTPITKGTSGSGIFSIAMFDKSSGVIVGGNYEKPDDANNNLAFTSDGGKSWKLGKGLSGYRSGVDFVDKKTIVAVGSSGSDLSIDGGKSWKNLDKENYNAVRAKGKNAIWAVGTKGLVAKFLLNNTESKLNVRAALLGYDKITSLTNLASFAPKIHIFFVKVNTILQGKEDSKYLKVVYKYFGKSDRLKKYSSNENISLLLKLRRNFSCDEVFDKDDSSNGFARNGSIVKVKHFENLGGLEEIETGKVLPCYDVSEK